MTRRSAALALALSLPLLLVSCGSSEAGKRYPMDGEIKALDPATKTATIDAGKIGDWMDAMVMEYPIKPDAEYNKLHVGDRIKATVVVNGQQYYVTSITVQSK